MYYFERNGVRLHWREEGPKTGQPVVFANSLGTDISLWDGLLAELPDHWRVIRFDKRGHGASSCPPAPYQIEDLLQDVEDLLDHLGVQNSLFIGTSIGGMVGIGLAERRPDIVKGLIITNSAVQMGQPDMWQARIEMVQAQGLPQIADQIMQRWFSPEYLSSGQQVTWKELLCRTSANGYIGCCHAIAGADLSSAAKNLSQPVLVIGGSEDQSCPPDTVRSTAEMIPNAEFQLIEGIGHLPSVEAPRVLGQKITKFSNEVLHG